MKKTLSILITLTFILSPVFVFAQESNPPRAIIVPETNTGTQAYGARQGASNSGTSFNASAASESLGSCALGSYFSTAVKSAVGGITSSLNPTDTKVPTNPVDIVAKEVGGIFSGMSWDSIGYCLVNSIIDYIGQSTVQWINSGFQGNPAFVDNPEQFFADIQDIEAGKFLNEISGGYLCSPLQAPVRLNLANSYNNSISPYSRRGSCTFTGISGNLDSFLSGQSFSWQDWISYNRPQNNTYGATVSAQLELDKRISSALGVESKLLDWGRGFLSFKDPETGKYTSPGSVIEGQVNKRLGNAEQRILMADEFDEIVTALVNQLVKIALNELTEATSGGGSSQNYNRGFNISYEDLNQNGEDEDDDGGILNAIYDDTVILCRFDLNVDDEDEIEYNGDCFPSQWMRADYDYSYEIPIRAVYCELPEDIEADSNEAEDYYTGRCVPPTTENIEFIESNNLLGRY